jgi:hypothetical protein
MKITGLKLSYQFPTQEGCPLRKWTPIGVGRQLEERRSGLKEPKKLGSFSPGLEIRAKEVHFPNHLQE